MEEPKWANFHIGHVDRLGIDGAWIPKGTNVRGCERFALEYGLDVLLLAFFIPLGKRSVTTFLLPGARIREHRFTVMRMLKAGIDDYQALRGILRFQANTKVEPMLNSFMKRLGFEVECVMKKYNDGQDYLQWAKIYEG